jgi:hypothetical protein
MILVQPRTVLRALFVISVGLVAMSLGTKALHWQISRLKLGHLTTLFNVGAEQTIPAWYSSGLLLLSAALFVLVALMKRQQGEARVWHWGGLGAIFLFMSIDEMVSIHEYLTGLRDNLQVGGLLYFAWVIPAMGLLAVFGLVYFRFWLGLPARTRWLLAASGALYVGGALALEMVGGAIFEQSRDRTTIYLIVQSAEELFEMLGVSLLIYTLLAHIRDHLPETRIVFAPAAAAEAVGARAAAEPAAAQGGTVMAD